MTQNTGNNRLLLVGAAVLAAVLVGAGVIIFSTSDAGVQGANFDYDQIPQSTTEDGAPVLGNADAPITIVEFADFMCPACQQYSSTMERVVEDLVLTGQAKVEYRSFLTVDRTGFVSGLVKCAVEEGANFWVAHDVMYDLAAQGGREVDGQAFAQQLGLSYGDLLNCVGDSDGEQIATDIQLGQRANVSGTPAIRIRYGDSPLQLVAPQYERGPVPYAALQALVQQANAS